MNRREKIRFMIKQIKYAVSIQDTQKALVISRKITEKTLSEIVDMVVQLLYFLGYIDQLLLNHAGCIRSE